MMHRYRSLAAIVAVLLVFVVPRAAVAQNVEAWFSKSDHRAAYGAIADEVEAMAQQFQHWGISDSILATRLEEGYRKHVGFEVLIASLRTDAQRAGRLVAMFREYGLFPSDTKNATSMVEQTLIFMRAGLTETEIRGALTVGVAKAGKNPKAASRALAALAVVAAANAKSELSEEDRLTLVTDLIASDLSESQFESMVAAKQASKSQGRQESSRASESGPTSESNRGQSGQHQPGQGNSALQGNENKQDDQGGQSQGSHGKK